MEDIIKSPEIPTEIPKVSSLEQQISEKDDIIEGLQFYSSPIRFNATLFQGFKLILDKLTIIEEKIAKMEANTDDRKNIV